MQKKIYTVATAHLDTIWSWDFETTVSRYIYNTLVDNFALFQKYPTYHFNFEGSYRYELMEEYYPELYAKMRDYIAQGRWSVCGSAFENGDVNVPSPEALFRNILFGNRYFEKKFGKRSVDIYLPDCFGFGWALPSIIAHANLMGFTTQKLGWGGAYGIPFDIGVWQGPDGAQVLASLNPHDYYFTLKKLRDWDFVQQKLDENEKYDLNSTMIFHGIGDRGGAPKEASVAFVEQEINKNKDSDVQVLASGADDLFRDLNAQLTPEQKAKLPRWETELVMQNHGVGGYTSRAVGKRWNRRCQELADMAERSGVVADYLGTAHYNKAAMELNWKRTIAHQFHDDLPGTSVQRAYRRSWNDYGMAMNGFAGELTQAAGSVGSLLKTDFCAGTPVTVFNSLEVARTDAVTLELTHWPKACARVYDPKGREVKSQVNRYENGTAELVFVATVPALGFAVYDVRPSDVPCRLRGSLSISSENQMENQKYIVRLNKKGNITSILDKEMDEQELLSEPISLGLFKYTGSKPWPAWEMNYKEANKDPDRLPNPVTVTMQEKGPARVSFCVEQKDGDSTFKNIIALTDGGSRVEVYSEIEWRSLHTMAKNKFAFACTNPEATFDLGLGAIRRGNMTEKLFEVPAQNWVDLTDKSGDWGVSVLSECKYGWDKYKDNTLRMTVLHSPVRNYRIDSMQSMMDLGLNRYSYALFSHKGQVGADTQNQARAFLQPLTGYVEPKHPGVLGTAYSFGNASHPQVVLRAMKLAEDGDEIVVRLNEGAGTPVEHYSLRLGAGVAEARELFASEEEKGPATVKDGCLVTDFTPYQIKTFALRLQPAAQVGHAAKATPLTLPMNVQLITKQGEQGELPLSIPAERIGNQVTAAGIPFAIAKDGKNALRLAGQTLTLKKDTRRLALLLSADSNRILDFTVGGKTVPCSVLSRTRRFASWDLYDLHETAHIQEGQLGYVSTHSHNADGTDAIAKELYFYILILNVQGGDTVVLPRDEETLVLAATELNTVAVPCATPLYDRVEDRPFDYTMRLGDKLRYLRMKLPWYMGDKGRYFSCYNRGRERE